LTAKARETFSVLPFPCRYGTLTANLVPKPPSTSRSARPNNHDSILRHLLHSAPIIAPANNSAHIWGNRPAESRLVPARRAQDLDGVLRPPRLFAEPARGAAPPPTSVTPHESNCPQGGQALYYCALELNVGERGRQDVLSKYPGIARPGRSAPGRPSGFFQRIAQEQAAASTR